MSDANNPETVEPVDPVSAEGVPAPAPIVPRPAPSKPKELTPSEILAQAKQAGKDAGAEAAQSAVADLSEHMPSKEWVRAEVELSRLGLDTHERAERNP